MNLLRPRSFAFGLRLCLLFLASVLLNTLVASAATTEIRLLLDEDNDAATGCDVTTVDGVFSGVEQILINTVETTGAPEQGTVADVALSDCVDPGTNTFSPPAPFDGGWPVGVDNGVGGRDVVETYAPLALLAVNDPEVIRLGVVAVDPQGERALLTVDDTPDGEPILLNLRGILEIPTTGEVGLLILSLLLAGLAIFLIGQRGALALALVCLLLSASAARAAGTLDGQTGDWSLDDLLASNGMVLFGTEDSDDLCFRIDLDLLFNTPPMANDDAYATDEDTVLNLPAPGVLANDVDKAPLQVTTFDGTSTQGAAVSVGSDGSFSYDPTGAPALQGLAAGAMTSDTFTYTVEDENGATDTATVTVTVTGVNDSPTAVADMFATDEDTQLVIASPGVLMNDSDPDGDPLTAVLDTDVSDGTLSLNADGSFTYDPDLDSNGTDSFTYHANDGTADSNTVTVTITVGPVNDSPNAVDDMFATDEDTVLIVAAPGVLLNDTDAEGDSLTVTAFDAASAQGATVSVNADGSFSYDPTGSNALQALAGGAMVNDTFSYTAEESGGNLTDTATVTIEVTGVDDAPTAVNDTATVTEDDPATTIDVQANDTDPDGGASTITTVTQPANGTVVITNAGADLTYEPDPNYCNDGVPTDDFTYTLSPGGDLATVAVTVTCVNDDPVADNETFGAVCNLESVVETDPGQTAMASGNVFRSVNDNVLVGDSDPVEGTAITIVQATGSGAPDNTAPFSVTTTQGGSATLYSDGSFVYTPEGGDRGVADSFMYTIQDADGGMASATVTLNVGSSCVWFVDNSNNGGTDDTGSGTSSDPFTSLVDEAGTDDILADDAEDATLAGDVVYVFEGNSTGGDPYAGGYTADANEIILGEGVDLVVDLGSGPETLFDSPTNVKPLVQGGVENGFDVLNADGVEIAGFDIESDAFGVRVQATAGTINSSIHDNSFDSGDSGLEATTPGGTLHIAANDNTDIISATEGMLFDGTSGTLVITSLCGNTIHGDTSGKGILVNSATFDADPADPDFTGDEVECTNGTVIGDSGNRIGRDGLALLSVTGDFDIGQLDAWVGTAGGMLDEFVLEIDGTGVFNAAAGTGFQFTTDAGTLDSIDGRAVDIDQADLENMILTSVMSQNSVNFGIGLSNVSGSFQVTGPTTISSTSNDGIAATDSSVAMTFQGPLALSNIGARGVDLQNSGPGNFSVLSSGSTIASTTQEAFYSTGSSGNIDFNGSINNTSNNSVAILNHEDAATISFDGTITDTGAGIFLTNNDQGGGASTINFTNNLSLTTGVNTAFQATSGGIINVTDPNNNNLVATTTGTGVSFINASIGGSGVKFQTVNVGDANPAAPNAANGIVLTNVGSGGFTATGGAIQNVSSRGLDISGGSGDVTVGASISTTTVGRSVEVTTHTGGTVDLNGAIDDNGIGIRLENNVASVLRFDGGMDVDTGSGTEEGFQATGGGTLHVTGTNDVDTSLTTGIAVNISGGTTIGSDDVTFRSVSADGAVSGIVLNSTGSSGEFEVTGSGTTDESGGVIDNTSGDAVSLNQVDSVTLRNMRLGESTTAQGDAPDSNIAIAGDAIDITDSSNLTFSNIRIADTSGDGIKGTGVTNLSLSDSEIFNVGLDAGSDETAFDFGDTTGGTDDNLLGTVTITNTVFDGMQEFGVYVYNDTGNLDLDISGGRFSNQRTNNAESGILVETDGTATMDVSVVGITCDVLEGGSCVFAQALGGTMDLVATDNTVQNGGSVSNFNNTDGFNLATGDGTLNFDISDNSIQRNRGHGVRLAANFGGTLNGQVTGNNIDGDGPFPPAASAQPILVQIDGGGAGDPSAFILIDNNDIDDVVDTILELIDIEARDGVTNLDITVTNNRLNQDAGATLGDGDHGIEVRARDSASVRAEVSNNTVTSPDASINLDVEDTSSMEATVVGNTLSSSGDDEFQANTEDAGTTLCLDLRGHTGGFFDLDEDAGNFNIENFASVAGDNSGATVSVGAGITADAGTCIEPTDPTFPTP